MTLSVFISYARHDYPYAKVLYDALLEAGYEPWLDLQNIPPGARWEDAILQQVANADVFLLIASPWSLASEVVRQEINLAVANQTKMLVLLIQTPQWHQDVDVIRDLPWLDLRRSPRNGIGLALKWLSGNDVSNRAALPRRAFFAPFFFDKVPIAVHLLFLNQFVSLTCAIGLSIVSVLWLFLDVLSYNIYTMSVISFKILPFMGIVIVVLLYFSLGQINLYRFVAGLHYRLYGRSEGFSEILVVGIASTYIMIGALLLIAAKFQAALVEDRILTVPYTVPPGASWLGPILIVIGVGTALVHILLMQTSSLKIWLPTYYSEWIPSHEVILARVRIFAKARWARLASFINRITVLRLRDSFRELTRRFRNQSGMDRRTRKFIDVPVLSPLKQTRVGSITLCYAPQDNAFGEYLAACLKNHVSSDLQALIIVLTPWVLRYDLKNPLEVALQNEIPIHIVLLEEIPSFLTPLVPQEIKLRNWIFANSSVKQGCRNIVAAIKGDASTHRQRLSRTSPFNAVSPDSVTLQRGSVFIAAVLTLSLLSVTISADLWLNAPPSLGLIVGFILFGLVASGQYIQAVDFKARHTSYGIYVFGQIVYIALELVILKYLSGQMTSYFDSVRNSMLVLFLGTQGTGLAILIFSPEARHWAVSIIDHGDDKEKNKENIPISKTWKRRAAFGLISPLFLVLGLWVMPLYARSRTDTWGGGPGQTTVYFSENGFATIAQIQARYLAQPYTIALESGMSYVAYIETFTPDLELEVSVSGPEDHKYNKRVKGPHTMVDATQVSGGDYRFVVAAVGDQSGAYRFTIYFYRPDDLTTPVECGSRLKSQITFSRIWDIWTFSGFRGQRIIVEMNFLEDSDVFDAPLESRVILYSEHGEILIHSTDSELAVIRDFELPQDGTYTIVSTSGQGSGFGIGPFYYELQFDCEEQKK